MKKTIFFIASAWMFCITSIRGQQISLDTIISPLGIGFDFYTVQISPTETKYYYADIVTNTFSLYNMDFTPFMTNISVPEPFDDFTFQAIYITRTLFDCDSSNIEYVYESPTNDRKPFRIMRTDGTVLFELDSANGPFCQGGCLGWSDIIIPIRNTSDGAKLFLQKYDSTDRQHIYIYSLCDSLPTDIFDFRTLNKSFVKLSPNPNSGLLNFQITCPDNMNEYELVIVDGNLKELRRKKIDLQNTRFTIDMTEFSSGHYYYSLCSKSKVYQAGKFIFTK